MLLPDEQADNNLGSRGSGPNGNCSSKLVFPIVGRQMFAGAFVPIEPGTQKQINVFVASKKPNAQAHRTHAHTNN